MTAGIRSILDALRFSGAKIGDAKIGPSALTADDLAFADRSHLTLLLADFDLAPPIRAHVDSAIARNRIRVERVRAAYEEIRPLFDHVALKGPSHVPDFISDVNRRVQYDLDLFVPPAERETALRALAGLGYEAIGGTERLAMDHLPPMVRKTGWQWRGDYFDPDLPPAVELHVQFWDTPTDRLRAEGVDGFWNRREDFQLSLVDRLGYAALHLTRHLLRGNVRAFHVWEIANFLHTHHDPLFWREWKRLHSDSLRKLEAVAFLLAKTWFGCEVADEPHAAIDELPAGAAQWFELYGWSPLETLFRPNKHELWLHTSLLDSGADRFDVLRRRLIPASMPGPVDGIHIPDDELTIARRATRMARNSAYVASRALHHARLFAPTAWEGFRWWLRSRP
jgi:Uncharacterised nucleotidyltransferase